jgi:hypothetical protein
MFVRLYEAGMLYETAPDSILGTQVINPYGLTTEEVREVIRYLEGRRHDPRRLR